MRPKIAEKVPVEDWELFRQICDVIEKMPPLLTGFAFLGSYRMPFYLAESHFIPSCHVVARALAMHFPVDVHDGGINEMLENGKTVHHFHSWLTRKGGDGSVIIDPWPLGVVSGPALFLQDYCFHFGHLCTPLVTCTKKFKLDVKVTALAMKKILKPRKTSILPVQEAA